MLTGCKIRKQLKQLLANGEFRVAVFCFAQQAMSLWEDPPLTGEKRRRLARAYAALAVRWKLNPHPRWGDRLLWWHREIVAGDPNMLAVLGPEAHAPDDQTLTIRLVRGHKDMTDVLPNRGVDANGCPYSLVGYVVQTIIQLAGAQGKQISEFTQTGERVAWIGRVERQRRTKLYADTPTKEHLEDLLAGPGDEASPSDMEAWRKVSKAPLVEVELEYDPQRGDDQESKHAIEYEVEWDRGQVIPAGQPYLITVYAVARTKRRSRPRQPHFRHLSDEEANRWVRYADAVGDHNWSNLDPPSTDISLPVDQREKKAAITTGESIASLPAAMTFAEIQETFKDAPQARDQYLFIPVTKNTTQAALIERWSTARRRLRLLHSRPASRAQSKISKKHLTWIRRKDQGDRYKVIAEDWNTTVAAVRQAVHRTRRKLKDRSTR